MADEKQGASKPPSKADIDQISNDQALIADEWAPQAPEKSDRTEPEQD